jgi:hypothetical protein
MVERSVIFQPDGKIEEYIKSALLIRNVNSPDES